jgi:large exoprotein involved in heme utilization and adhesion
MTAGQVQLDNGTISAKSSGTAAAAGNVNVIVGSTLRMKNSSITTEAALADGGNISITSTGSLLHMTNSQITTSVGQGRRGQGAGGDIRIGSGLHPFDFLVLNNSGIHADAFGGPGGNINIFADLFLSSLPIGTAVTASSALSTPGTIDIQASIVDVSGDISQLPEAPLQATELLRAACAARLAGGKSSSLVLAGRGGLPVEPGGLLASPPYLGAHSAISSQTRRLAGDKLNFSQSSFSLFGPSSERIQLGMGRDHFQLAKSALGLGCSY